MHIHITSKHSNYTITIHSSFLSPFTAKQFIHSLHSNLLLLLPLQRNAESKFLENTKFLQQHKTMIPQKEVIISVYVEAPKVQNNNKSHQNPNPLKNINPKSAPPKTPKSKGYDRRAQLLAYSRELRNLDSSMTQLPKSKSKARNFPIYRF